MAAQRKRVLGVLAGADVSLEQLGAWARSADVVIAADSGADRLLAAGVVPSRTIGDLDSLKAEALANVILDPDQETTDCDKLLALAIRLEYDEITLIGVEGDRLDHMISTLFSAWKAPLRVRLALRTGQAWLIRGNLRVATEEDDVVSLMPLQACANVSLRGVAWPLRNVPMSPIQHHDGSGMVDGKAVEVDMAYGAAALFLLAPRLVEPSWP